MSQTLAQTFSIRRLGARLELRMLALALLVFVGLSLASPFFLRTNNLLNLLDQSVVTGITAIGMTFVVLTGGIDLSVGSVLGFTGVLMGQTIRAGGYAAGLGLPVDLGIALGIAVAVVAGAAIGLFSGVLVARFGLASFVVTLGVMAIGRSLAYIVSGQNAIADIPPQINDLVYTSVLGVPSNVATLLVLYALAWCYLTLTKGGRTIYAIGSNREAARTAGLAVLGYSILPYVLSGAAAAIAGVLLSAQILSIDPLAGTALELDAIAAVVIGGASLYGGRGSILGTLIGVLIMVMIRNGLNLLGVSPFWQGSAIGGIIIAAVLAERLLSTRMRG
jgi:ribose transport system permease protein